jgi:glycerol-1-phosphate dehydrogenase [NAD(P)+]
MDRIKTDHTNKGIKVSIGHDAIPELLVFLRELNIHHLVLVSDQNQYAALGAKVEKALLEAGFQLDNIILTGDQVEADEKYVVQAFLPSRDIEQLYIAVGSGTVTDIVRFVSYRAKSYFISLPTAPSVDGFASNGSSMTILDFKQTVNSRPPLAIFADLKTLINAPEALIASGFGDMFGKFTALADWKLAHLVNGDPYDQQIADRSRKARDHVVLQSKSLSTDRENSIKAVMEALIEEGLCMLDFGNSRPASGSEHQFSHYWEMMLHRQRRPAVFHGSKVGLASIWISKYYQLILGISKDKARTMLSSNPQLDPQIEIQKIKDGYGELIAPAIIKTQKAHLVLTPDNYRSLGDRIIEKWDDIQAIAREVPGPDRLTELLLRVGGAAQPADIGLTDTDIRHAMDYAQYVRKAFTVLNICQMLGIKPQL